MASYILGTINNYLVKKDVRLEADRKLLQVRSPPQRTPSGPPPFAHGQSATPLAAQALEEYAALRKLPDNLTQRLRRYFEFQQHKQQQDADIQSLLPRSMKVKLARHLHADVLVRNAKLFQGCNQQFLAQLLVNLKETHMMPGEVLVRRHENTSHLVFVTHGILELHKDGKLLRLIRALSEAPNVACEVPFFMNTPQPYTVQCSEASDVTCLLLSHAVFDSFVQGGYLEQKGIITANLLASFALQKDGSDMAGGAEFSGSDGAEEEAYLELRGQIKAALKKRLSEKLSGAMYRSVWPSGARLQRSACAGRELGSGGGGGARA